MKSIARRKTMNCRQRLAFRTPETIISAGLKKMLKWHQQGGCTSSMLGNGSGEQFWGCVHKQLSSVEDAIAMFRSWSKRLKALVVWTANISGHPCWHRNYKSAKSLSKEASKHQALIVTQMCCDGSKKAKQSWVVFSSIVHYQPKVFFYHQHVCLNLLNSVSIGCGVSVSYAAKVAFVRARRHRYR